MLAFAILTALLLLPSVKVAADAIAAWYGGGLQAPQVAMWDEAQGKMFYSLCNSNGTPIFPYNDDYALQLDQKPIRNTNVAGSVGPENTVSQSISGRSLSSFINSNARAGLDLLPRRGLWNRLSDLSL